MCKLSPVAFHGDTIFCIDYYGEPHTPMKPIIENIGMDCGLMPITGIPLPFVSYGSSFMVVNFIMLGLIGSVWSHKATLRR